MSLDTLLMMLVSVGSVFEVILTMTVASSIVIALFLLGRKLLLKAPKGFTYILWLAVVFRLLCPVTLDLPVSIMPEFINDGKWIAIISEMDLVYDAKEVAEAPELWFDSIKTEEGYEFGTRLNGMAPAMKVGDVIIPLLFIAWIIGAIVVLIKELKKQEIQALLKDSAGLEKLFVVLAFIGKTVHWFNPLVRIFYNRVQEDVRAWGQDRAEADKSAATMVKGIVIVAVLVLVAFIGKNSVISAYETDVNYSKSGIIGNISYEANEKFAISVTNETDADLILSPSAYLFKWERGQWRQMEFKLPANYIVEPYAQNVPAGQTCDEFHIDFYKTLELEKGKYMLVIPVLSGGKATDALEAEFEIK